MLRKHRIAQMEERMAAANVWIDDGLVFTITLRYNSRLHHIGLSKRRHGTHVIVLINDLDIRIRDRDIGHLIRKLVLDPTRDYQPAASNAETAPKTGCRCKPCLGTPVNDVPRHDAGSGDSGSGDRIRTCDLWDV